MSITDALTSSPQSLIDETKVLSNGSCNGIYNGIAHEETHKNLSVCNGQNKSLQNNVEHKTEPGMMFVNLYVLNVPTFSAAYVFHNKSKIVACDFS